MTNYCAVCADKGQKTPATHKVDLYDGSMEYACTKDAEYAHRYGWNVERVKCPTK